MTIHYDYESQETADINYEELADRVINVCIDYVECPYESEISILFTDDEQIHEINKEFRSIDRPTDVLSFPAVEFSQPGYFDDLEDGPMDYFHPETGELILGDIVVSIETARRQSIEYNHSMLREVAFLIAHSMLHLVGYDHMTDEERVVMEKKQEEIMDILQIYR